MILLDFAPFRSWSENQFLFFESIWMSLDDCRGCCPFHMEIEKYVSRTSWDMTGPKLQGLWAATQGVNANFSRSRLSFVSNIDIYERAG